MKNGLLTRRSQIVVTVLASVLLFSGCGSIGKQQSLLNIEDSPPSYELYPDNMDASASHDDTTTSSSENIILLMQKAGELCQNNRFYSADSLYRLLLPQLNTADGDSCIDEITNEIVAIYSTVIPDTISIPEEIALQVYRQRMVLALDSLSFDASDSTVVSKLIKRSTRHYDIPVTWNERVEKSLFYYMTRNQITIEYWKKRSSIYLSFMKKMFADSVLPQDLAYLPLIESGFNPKAYSRSHASGIWQFIPSTGKSYGLRSNYWIDERRDPVRSTNAAIRYLKKLYNNFGHWYLALAAYNCGEGALSKAIERCGNSDYWQLHLPKETMNYVPLYLAALTIAKDPEFAVDVETATNVFPFDTVTVNECLDLREVATGTGVEFDSLKKLNPHILHWCTPPDMTNVLLYLPSGTAESFRTFYTALPDEKKVKWYRYKVQTGDNLGSIARHFKMPVESIKSVNKLRGNTIIAGHYLFIPIAAGNTEYQMYSEPPQTITAAADAVRKQIPADASCVVYKVKSGDTVWKLAELFGVTSKQICDWNGIPKAKIKAGQILSIYSKTRSGNGMQAKTHTSQIDDKKNSVYIVQPGDTPYHISRMFAMTITELCSMNGLTQKTPVIYPGDTLRIKKTDPIQDRKTARTLREGQVSSIKYIVAAGDNCYRIAQNFSISVAAIQSANNLTATSVLQIGDTIQIPTTSSDEALAVNRFQSENKVDFYTVKHGDNLWRIANSLGIPMKDLFEYNGLQSNSVLMPGDTIRFSRKDDL